MNTVCFLSGIVILCISFSKLYTLVVMLVVFPGKLGMFRYAKMNSISIIFISLNSISIFSMHRYFLCEKVVVFNVVFTDTLHLINILRHNFCKKLYAAIHATLYFMTYTVQYNDINWTLK